jgi:hypothetical protein
MVRTVLSPMPSERADQRKLRRCVEWRTASTSNPALFSIVS